MRIAYFSPLPPQRSGIADYSEALLPHLSAHCEIDVFIEDYTPASAALLRDVRVRHWREFEKDHQHGLFDTVLYHVGNNPQHVYIYDMARRIPGVLMLHEFNLHYLLAAATISRGDWDAYLAELRLNAGENESSALAHYERVRRGETEPEYNRYAMNFSLIKASRGAIVHSRYMEKLIRDFGFSLPVGRILHGVALPEIDRAAARAALGLNGQRIAGAFGFLKPYKRIHSAIEAMTTVVRRFPGTQLLLVGEEHPHYPLRPLIADLGLQDHVRIPGFVTLDDFWRYIAACDACISLRYPTVGETSGSLLRELASGRPVVVSDIGAFSEIPDECCLKIPPGDRESQWLGEYLTALFGAPPLADSLGANARDWIARECSWPKVAGEYAGFLSQFRSSSRPEGAAAQAAPQEQAGTAPQSGAGLPGREELARYILGFGSASRGMEEYTRVHLHRLVRTLELVPPARKGTGARILEMGCYMQITPALSAYLGYDEVIGSYYGQAGRWEEKAAFSASGETFRCRVDLFDAEKDFYPYPDAAFETVLCCELIEHLYHDPMHMMSEINRILKTGGRLLLTTPNIAAARGLHALLHGYHPGLFHTYVLPNADGKFDPRHNREYAPRDIRALMESAGLETERLETGWYREEDAARYRDVEQLLAGGGFSRDLRGDIIYAVGRKAGPVRERYPQSLYTAF